MTISTDTASASYTGNGVTQIFPVPFYFLVDTDLKVSRKVAATGVVSVLTLNSDYTVTGAGVQAGGSITTPVAPATGDQLFIERNVDAVQETAYPVNGIFPAASHEKALDRLTMLVQQILSKLTFGLFRDPLGGTYDAGGGAITNAADATGGTGLATLQQVTNLVNSVIAGTASFIAAGVGAVVRNFQDKAREQPSALDVIPVSLQVAIAANTSTTDVSGYIAQAASNYSDVLLPAGTYYVTHGIAVPSGVRIRGAGRHKTVLLVPATFDMTALGVFRSSGSEPGAIFEDFTIRFVQPDTTVRTNLTQYPPAFYLQNTPRFAIRRVRVELAWNGIDMKGNTGGAVIDDFECSSFNIDIDIDGAVDSVKLSRLHLWPFGLTSRPSLYTLYQSNLATGIKCGRCDDFKMTNSIVFSKPVATNFYQSASGSTFGSIQGCDFDDGGGLNVSAGAVAVTGCTFTLGRTDSVLANIAGGSVALCGCQFSVTVLPNGGKAILVTGSTTQVNVTGCLYGSGSVDATAVSAGTGSTLTASGNVFNRTLNIVYANPTVLFNSAKGAFTGNTASDIGGGSGVFCSVVGDTGVVVAANNNFGWRYAMPSGATSVTRYSNNGVAGIGTANPTPNGSGIATFAHGLPIQPTRVLIIARGTGGFVHCQFVSADNTNITMEARSTTGVITTAITVDWVAFT